MNAAPQRGHRGTRAVQRMVEYAPSTGGLALWVQHRDLPADTGAEAPPVATDGHALYYAPAFERCSVEEQAGWVAHEVLHIALRHPQRCDDLQRLTGDVDRARGEQCDSGAGMNDGRYGGCSAACTKGPRCGDRNLDSAQGEQCDDGNLNDFDGCSAHCLPEIVF